MNITFHPNPDTYIFEENADLVPQLQFWNITDWNWFYIKIKLNFTRPLKVSSEVAKHDNITIKFSDHQYFVALKDQFMLAENYTVLTSILSPLLASEEDA